MSDSSAFTPALVPSTLLPIIEPTSDSEHPRRHRKRSSVRYTVANATRCPSEPRTTVASACGCFSVPSNSPKIPAHPSPPTSTSPDLEHPAQDPHLAGPLKLERSPARPTPKADVVRRLSAAGFGLAPASQWVGSVFDGILGYSIPIGWVEQGEREEGYESDIVVAKWRERVHRELNGLAGWESI